MSDHRGTPAATSGGRPNVAEGPGQGDSQGMDEHDVVVVGGGAAGLSAALVLTRARRRGGVGVAGEPRTAPAAPLHGVRGSDGMPPSELVAAGRSEITGYGGELVSGTVASITQGAQSVTDVPLRFDIVLDGGSTLRSHRVLITTGLRDEVPDVPGVRERWGRDLLHCPYCHGYELRDQPLGVLSGSPDLIAETVAHAHLIRQWTDNLVFFTNGTVLTDEQRDQFNARAIGVIDEPVARLVVENDQLTGVALASGKVVPRTAVFVRPQFVPNDALLVSLGCATNENGWVVVDATGRTSVPGIWAAGNAVNPRAQVITAAGEGSAAAIAVNDLVDCDLLIAIAGSHDLPV